jgi:hypothetical protein
MLSTTATDTVTCYRPTGPKELALVRESGFRRWPPRLPEQPIFYPVCNEEYAIQIARDWNAPHDGAGYVTRFEVRRAFMDPYPVQTVSAGTHTEWWIPAEDLNALNENIVGLIEVIHQFTKESEQNQWSECGRGPCRLAIPEPWAARLAHFR